MSIHDDIRVFREQMVAPAFAEIKQALERKQLRVVLFDDRSGDDAIDQLFERMHGATPVLGSAAPEAGKRYLGPSLAICELAPQPDPLRGKFLMTIVLDVAADDVYAAPVAFYFMQYDSKLHRFDHRFDNAVEQMSIARIDKPKIQNYLLGSFTFYRMHAGRAESPF
jgi:hypothetical protein